MQKFFVIIASLLLLNSMIFFTVTSTQNYNSCYDMIIFISPQYCDSVKIHQSIDDYCSIVKDELGWNILTINVTSQINNFNDIDIIIEQYYQKNPLKACIMVGEDLDTALHCDQDYQDSPSSVPWNTIGGNSSYSLSENGIIKEPHLMEICISLLYPTSDLDYSTKESQIYDVFQKFSNNRDVKYTGSILAYVDKFLALSHNTREKYQMLSQYGSLIYKENPTKKEVSNSLLNKYSMYLVHGHSTCSYTLLNPFYNLFDIKFEAQNLDTLDTPFFGASGCYVNGWWSGKPDNNQLDPSITRDNPPYYSLPHYSSRIFTSPYVHAMILGILTEEGYPYPVSFLEHAIANFTQGKTIAESLIGHIYCGDDVFFVGDPTFHYSFINKPPNKPDKAQGSTFGETAIEYDYLTRTIDPENDDVYYLFDWRDGTTSDWLGPYKSGDIVSVGHSWDQKGNYAIRSKSKDSNGHESGWSDPLYVEITGNTAPFEATINGPTSGNEETAYEFSVVSTDPDGDQIYYLVDWDDGTTTEWLGPYKSGETVNVTHTWIKRGKFELKVKVKDINESETKWSEPFKVLIASENTAPSTATIKGSKSGKANKLYTYKFNSSDPENDDLYYLILWGDEDIENWIGPYNSGEELELSHAWSEKESYTIKVKVKDIFDEESDWASLNIVMTKSKFFNLNIFERFLHRYPLLCSLIKLLLEI